MEGGSRVKRHRAPLPVGVHRNLTLWNYGINQSKYLAAPPTVQFCDRSNPEFIQKRSLSSACEARPPGQRALRSDGGRFSVSTSQVGRPSYRAGWPTLGRLAEACTKCPAASWPVMLSCPCSATCEPRHNVRCEAARVGPLRPVARGVDLQFSNVHWRPVHSRRYVLVASQGMITPSHGDLACR